MYLTSPETWAEEEAAKLWTVVRWQLSPITNTLKQIYKYLLFTLSAFLTHVFCFKNMLFFLFF